jgi:hypothetical protein
MTEKRFSFGTPTPASPPPLMSWETMVSMVCWNVAAQAASTISGYSEPVDDGLFTMEGTRKRSPF